MPLLLADFWYFQAILFLFCGPSSKSWRRNYHLMIVFCTLISHGMQPHWNVQRVLLLEQWTISDLQSKALPKCRRLWGGELSLTCASSRSQASLMPDRDTRNRCCSPRIQSDTRTRLHRGAPRGHTRWQRDDDREKRGEVERGKVMMISNHGSWW